MALALTLALASYASARSAGTPNTYEIIGNSGVSAQQMFLGSANKVYIIDKTERNGNNLTIDIPIFHPAWSSEYDLDTDTAQPMDIITNSFCAGGVPLGNGTWLNVGGNNAVGLAGNSVQPGDGPYLDQNGGQIVRLLSPCPWNDTCSAEWTEWPGMTTNRWYPTLVAMNDGSGMIIGGELYGGYVNDIDQHQNNPTIEYVPPRATGVEGFPFLAVTQPLNLFPIAWLLPSGNLFLQAGNSSALYNFETNTTTFIADIPGGQRTYPASAGVAMLPLTPANNWTATAIFCGGLDQNANVDYNPLINDVTNFVGTTSCVTIQPDVTPNQYDVTDDLIDGTVMLNLINLPDGRLFGTGGCGLGTAGYGWQNFGNGQGYGKEPRLMPAGYYNHSAPAGSRWSQAGITASTVPRMYHSSATLLPDGSVMVAGSNPSADFVGVTVTGVSVNASDPYHTEYRVERFYPDYWGKPRPVPSTPFPQTISYGGAPFNVTLPVQNVTSVASLNTLQAVLIRTGFATHVINFGQMHVDLETSYKINSDGSATVFISQLPPNPNMMAPGPALLFLLMNGVPSIAEFVMVGSGQIETQPTQSLIQVPPNDSSAGINPSAAAAAASSGAGGAGNSSNAQTGSTPLSSGAKTGIAIAAAVAGSLALLGLILCLCRRRSARKAHQNAVYQAGYGSPTDSMEKVKASMASANNSSAYLDSMPYRDNVSPAPQSPGMGYTSQRTLPEGANPGR